MVGDMDALANNADKVDICPNTGEDTKDLGPVTKIVTCYHAMLDQAVEKYIDELYSYFQTAIAGFLTLTVAFFGANLSSGGIERPAREGMTLLLKIAGIVAFTQEFNTVYGWLMDGVNDTLALVTVFISDIKAFNCAVDTEMWEKVDCILDAVIGFNNPEYIAKGILSFVQLLFASGVYGILVGVIGVCMIAIMLLSLAKAILVYLISITAIAFLSIFASVFIPLLAMAGTAIYFQQWLRLIVGFIFQPLVLFAYLGFMFIAFDAVIYSGSHSVYRTIAGDAVDAEDFALTKYLVQNGIVQKDAITLQKDHDPTANQVGEFVEGEGALGRIRRVIEATVQNAQTQHGFGLQFHVLDMCKMAEANPNHLPTENCEKEVPKILLIVITFAFFVVFMFKAMLDMLPRLTGAVTSQIGADQSIPGQQFFTGGARRSLGI
jgi:hypothetical protein